MSPKGMKYYSWSTKNSKNSTIIHKESDILKVYTEYLLRKTSVDINVILLNDKKRQFDLGTPCTINDEVTVTCLPYTHLEYVGDTMITGYRTGLDGDIFISYTNGKLETVVELTKFKNTQEPTKSVCNHKNKYLNVISHSLKFYVCPDCGEEVDG